LLFGIQNSLQKIGGLVFDWLIINFVTLDVSLKGVYACSAVG